MRALLFTIGLICLLASSVNAKPVSVDQALWTRVQALGTQHPLVVVFRPDRWTDTYAVIRQLTSAMPPEAQRELDTFKTPQDFLPVLSRMTDLRTPIDPATIDWTRPIIAGLYAPPFIGPPGASATGFTHQPPLMPGVGFTLDIPAKNPAALASSLGPKAKAHGDTVVLNIHDVLHAPRPFTPPAHQVPTMTPALQALLDPTNTIAIYGRSWMIRSATAYFGLEQMQRALEQVPPEYKTTMLAHGVSLVLSGERIMADGQADFDDHTLILRAHDGALHTRLLSSLTPQGLKAINAGLKGGVGPLHLIHQDVQATAWIGAHLEGVISMSKIPQWLALGQGQKRALPQAFQRVQECGTGCLLDVVFRNPFGVARGAFALDPTTVVIDQIKALQGVQFAALPSGQWALAATVTDSFVVTDLVKSLIQKLGATHTIEAIGGHKTILLSHGVDAKTVFGTPSPRTPKQLSTTRLSGQFIKNVVRPMIHMPTGWATPLESVTFQAQQSERAVVLDGLLLPTGSKATMPSIGDYLTQWIPQRSYPASAGDPCITQAQFELVRMFHAIANADPSTRKTLFKHGLTQAEPQLACAEKHAPTRAAALGLRALIKQIEPIKAQ